MFKCRFWQNRFYALHHGYGELFTPVCVVDGIVRAYIDAVEAVNTSASVYNMVIQVYAAAFAYIHAFAALDAFVCINLNLEY